MSIKMKTKGNSTLLLTWGQNITVMRGILGRGGKPPQGKEEKDQLTRQWSQGQGRLLGRLALGAGRPRDAGLLPAGEDGDLMSQAGQVPGAVAGHKVGAANGQNHKGTARRAPTVSSVCP